MHVDRYKKKKKSYLVLQQSRVIKYTLNTFYIIHNKITCVFARFVFRLTILCSVGETKKKKKFDEVTVILSGAALNDFVMTGNDHKTRAYKR